MVEYTYEQVMQALRAADAAGATEDARRLAQIAQSMSQPSEPLEPQGPTFRSVMGQINKEIAEGAGGLVDFINPFDEYTGSAVEGLKSAMRAGGIEVAEREAQGRAERAAAGLGQAASAVIPVAKGAQYLQQAGGLLGQVARQVAPSLMTTGGVAAELAAGAGAGAAQAEAERRGYGETAQQVAGIAGGIGTGVIPATTRAIGQGVSRAADYLPIRAAGRAVAAQVAPFTEAGGTRLASQRFQELAGGKDRAAEIAERMGAESELGLSPAQMTGEEALIRAERKAMQDDPSLAARVEAQRIQSEASAAQALGQDGNVKVAQDFLQNRIASFENTLNNFVKAAQASAEKKVLGSDMGNEEASTILGNELRRAKEAARSQERMYWSKIPQEVKIETPETSALVLGQPKQLGEYFKGDIPTEVTRFRKKYAKKDKMIKVKDINSLYSKLRSVQRDAMSGANPNSNQARLAGEVADAILRDLDAIQPADEFGLAVFNARSFSKQLHDKFSKGTVGSLLQKKAGGEYKTPIELTLDRSIGQAGIKGGLAQRDIDAALTDLEGPVEARNVTANYIRNKFNESAFTDGKFSLARAQSFLKRSEPLLGRLPTLRKEIDDAIAAQKRITSVEKRVAPISKAVEQSTTAKFASANPERALDAVSEAADPQKAMAALVQSAKKDQTGAALSGVKAAMSRKIIQSSLEKLQTPRVEGGPDVELRGTRLSLVLDDPAFSKMISEVYSPEEVSRIRVISNELKKLDMSRTRGAVEGGLDPFRPNSTLSLLARVVGARLGARLGGVGMGGSLQTAQIGSARMQRLAERLTNDRAQQIMMRALEDKELFRTLLLNPTNPKNFKRIERSLAPYLVGTAAATQEQ